MPPAPLIRLAAWAILFASAVPRTLSAQATDPRDDFLNALGQFSLALEGTFGDEGRVLSISLAAMADSLSRWDAQIRSQERAMAADIANADPQLAARMHLALGSVYLDRLRVSDALAEFAAARQRDPGLPQAALFTGLTHSQLTGDAPQATRALQEAHALAPRDPVRTYLLARQLLAANQTDAGIELLKRIQHGTNEMAAGQTATPFIRLDLVREAPSVEPFFPPVLYAEAFAALQKGELAQALARLRDSIRRDPLATSASAAEDPVANAAAAYRQGAVSDARTYLESARRQSPDRAEVHRLLGMVDLADGNPAAAIASLRTAVKLNPDDERARLSLAAALIESNQPKEAEEALLDTLRVLPTSGRAHYLLGLTYQRQGKSEDALRELQTSLSLKPLLGANTIHRMIGTLQQQDQRLEEAAQSFLTRVDLVPNDAAARRQLGQAYLQQGDDVRARAEFEIAALLNPADADSLTAIAQVLLRTARNDDAVEVSRRALQLDPSHREARYVYATALLRTGKTEEGAAEMQAFERLQAQDGEARARAFELGRLRREASNAQASGDHATAVALLRRALVHDPRSASSHLDLGLALLAGGQAAEAAERLATAAALNAPFEVHHHLARAYAALGRTDESQKAQATYDRLRREAIGRTGKAR